MTRRRVLTLARTVDQFEASLQLLGRRPRGVQTYRQVLDYMIDVLGGDTDPTTLTHADMIEVVTSWLGTSTTTIAQRVSVLRTFGAFLADDLGLHDPTTKLKRPKRRKPVRRRPDRDGVADLYRVAEGRDKLLVATLAMTGMRVFELRALRWRDIDEARCLVHIEDGKGGKGRTVPIPAALAFMLRDERSSRRSGGLSHPDHFVCCEWQEWETPTGGQHRRIDPAKPCGQATPFKILARLSKQAGIPSITPHQLRRAYADSYLTHHRGDLVGLQFLLGHERVETTRDYLDGVRIEDAAQRIASVDFVTPSAEDSEPPIGDPPQGSRLHSKYEDSGGGGNRTRASVEPGTQAGPNESSDASPGSARPDIVTDPEAGA